MYVAIDIGGTKTLVALFNQQGEIVRQDKHPTHIDYDKFIDETIKSISSIIDNDTVHSICIAAPGLVDYESGTVKSFGNLEWKNVDIKHKIEQEFNIPTLIDNDANLGAVGEANYGAGANYKNTLYVTISTGIGTGITTDGKIDPALAHSEGGHIYFMHEGEYQPWEKFASGKSFYDDYQKMGVDVPASDPIWDEWSEKVALGLSALNTVIQPDVIVIGGSMGEHYHKYSSHLLRHLKKLTGSVTMLPPILEAEHPHKAVIIGCFVEAKRLHDQLSAN